MKKLEFEQVKHLIKKTSLANIGAFLLVVVGLPVTVYYGKWELAGALLGAGAAYLFQKRTE